MGQGRGAGAGGCVVKPDSSGEGKETKPQSPSGYATFWALPSVASAYSKVVRTQRGKGVGLVNIPNPNVVPYRITLYFTMHTCWGGGVVVCVVSIHYFSEFELQVDFCKFQRDVSLL